MSHLRDRLRVTAGLAPLRHVEAMLVLSEHLGIAEAQERYPGMVEQAEALPRYEEIPELELDGSGFDDPFQCLVTPLPAIGSRVDVPFVQRRIAKVIGHKDGLIQVEMPGGSVELVRLEDVQGVG